MTLFFNIVADIVQTFIKFWSQLLYPRVIEIFCLPFEPHHDFFLHLIIVKLFPIEMFLWLKKDEEIAGREVRNVWWIVQCIALEFLQMCIGDMHGMGLRIVEQAHAM
jgi:hypothetical protein